MTDPASSSTTAGTIELMILTLPTADIHPGVIDQLRSVVDAGHARLLDLAAVMRGDDGSVVIYDEVDELAQVGLGELSPPDSLVVLSDDDLAFVADQLDPGQSALVAVCEESWVSRVADAADRAGGRLGMHAHVSPDAYAAAAAPTT